MNVVFNTPLPSEPEHPVPQHGLSYFPPMDHDHHDVSVSGCQEGDNDLSWEPATAFSLPFPTVSDYYPVNLAQELSLQEPAVPSTHHDSLREDLGTPYPSPSHEDGPFSPTYRNLNLGSHLNAETQLSDIVALTGGQRIVQFGGSGGCLERMDAAVRYDTTHYQRGPALNAQWPIDVFQIFREQVDDYPQLGHPFLKPDGFTKLVSPHTDDTRYPRTYRERDQASATLPVPVPYPQRPSDPSPNKGAAPIKNISETVLPVVRSPVSNAGTTDKQLECRWKDENQVNPCSTLVSDSNLPEHLAENHLIKNIASHEKIKCRICDPPKPIKRESLLRHIREVHRKQKRKPSTKKKKGVEGRPGIPPPE